MENSNETTINLTEIFVLLARNISKIIIAGILTALIAFTYTQTMITPMYQSTAKMVIKVVTADTLTTYSDVQIAVGLVNDCVEIIRSREIMQEIIDELDLDYTPEQLLSQISISVPADTRVLRVSVTNSDPQLAKDIAEQLCRASESTVAKNVGVDSINTFEFPTTPTAPSSPNVAKNTFTGAFAGIVAFSAYVIIKKLLNNKIYTPEDAEQVLGLSVFAAVPYIADEEEKAKKNSKTASLSKGGKK